MAEADVLRVILSLVAVVLLLLGAAWLTRRAGLLRTGNTRAIQVLGMQNLGGRGYLALVQVEDTRLLLGITATNINLLHTLDDSAAAPENSRKEYGVNAGSRTSGTTGTASAEGGIAAGASTTEAAGTGVVIEHTNAHGPTPKPAPHRFAQVLGKALKRR